MPNSPENITPRILYKYRILDQDRHLEKMLKNGEIYFARLEELNDPCEYYFVFTNPVYRNISKNEYEIHKNKNEIMQELNSGDQNGNNYLVLLTPEAYTECMQKSFNFQGIFSLSAHCNSIPMWAFYGDALKGVCIGFEWSKFHYQIPPYQVQYEAEPVKIYSQHLASNITKINTTKSTHFHFENEYRIFDQAGKQSSDYIRQSIQEIIFGENFFENKENVETVISWTHDIPGVEYFVAKRVLGKYEIVVSKIEVAEFLEVVSP